jgi:hypothetical protein
MITRNKILKVKNEYSLFSFWLFLQKLEVYSLTFRLTFFIYINTNTGQDMVAQACNPNDFGE